MSEEEISLTLMIVIGVLISLFLRNENFNHSITLNKIIFDCNPLYAQLNPICPLLALFGTHHILHVSM